MNETVLIVGVLLAALAVGQVLFSRHGEKGTAIYATFGTFAAGFWLLAGFFLLFAGQVGLVAGGVLIAVAFYFVRSNARTAQREAGVSVGERVRRKING